MPDRLKLTFFFPYRQVSGVPMLFSRLALHLAHRRDADVEVVDYRDGYMAGAVAGDASVRLVPFEAGTLCRVPPDRLLVMQSILPATLHPELQPDPSTRLLFWTLHAMNFVQALVPTPRGRELQASHPWITRAAGRTVLRSFARDLRAFVEGLRARGSLAFVDGSTWRATRESLGLALPDPEYIPTPCPVTPVNPGRDATLHSPLAAAWVGRLDDFKVPMLVYTLRQLSALSRTREIAMTFTIVGDGPLAGLVRNELFEHDRFRIVRRGALTPAALDTFLSAEADVLFAMGTSALEGARFGVPTVLLDVAYGPVPDGYPFSWLFESTNFGLGAVLSQRSFERGNRSLERIVDAVLADRPAVSARTHAYCLANHSTESVADRFMQVAAHASFQWSGIPPRLRRKSPLRRAYERVRARRRASITIQAPVDTLRRS